MNETFRENLSFLYKIKPGYFEKFKKFTSFSHIKIIRSRTGPPVPVVDGIHVHSRYDPVKEADNLVSRNKGFYKDGDNFIIIGWGFAYHIIRLIDKFNPHKIYIFEADPGIFFKSLEYIKVSRIMGRDCEILLGSSFDTINDLGEMKTLIKSCIPSIFKNIGSYNLHKGYYDKLIRKITYYHDLYKGDIFSREQLFETPFDSELLNNFAKNSENDQNIFSIIDKVKENRKLTIEELALNYLENIRLYI